MKNKTIEVKKIDLDATAIYTASNYPESGIYEVGKANAVVYVNKTSNLAFFIDGVSALDSMLASESSAGASPQGGNMSEEFVLRLVAIASNKEPYKETT